MVGEIVAGILANSLALLSDAAHMLTDAGALLLSLVVLRLVRRPARGNVTFGLRRMEVLSAQANGATLLVLAGLIVFGAVHRLVHPPEPGRLDDAPRRARRDRRQPARDPRAREGQPLVAEHRGLVPAPADRPLRVRRDRVAGIVILTAGFNRADPIAALLVAALMLRAALGLLRASGRVLLEIAPEGLDVEEIGSAMAAHPHVTEVHDLHVWEIGSSFPALSAHVLVEPEADCHAIRRDSSSCSTSASRSTTRPSRSTTPAPTGCSRSATADGGTRQTHPAARGCGTVASSQRPPPAAPSGGRR